VWVYEHQQVHTHTQPPTHTHTIHTHTHTHTHTHHTGRPRVGMLGAQSLLLLKVFFFWSHRTNGWPPRGWRHRLSAACYWVQNMSAWSSQIKLSHFGTVLFRVWQSFDRFQARRHALPLHSLRQGFGNDGVCCWHKFGDLQKKRTAAFGSQRSQ
jgi:hypothetical protein